MTPEQIRDAYHPRILALLGVLATKLKNSGFSVDEPDILDDMDEYRWGFMIDFEKDLGPNKKVIIDMRIAESEQYDGSANGVTFAIDMVESGGRILGGMVPFNYTPEVWVSRDDPEGIQARFVLFEDADFEGCVDLVRYHFESEKSLAAGRKEG